ncbi:hypothetical protein D3C74_446970 [compost metagenome]
MGTVMVRFTATLASKMRCLGTGELLSIQRLFPSREMELDVVQLKAANKETKIGASVFK